MENACHAKRLSAGLLNGPSTVRHYGSHAMIDYISLALGHGLLAIALLRLVMRVDLDIDPRIQSYADEEKGAARGGPGCRAQRAAAQG